MEKLENIRNGALVRGVASSEAVQIVSVEWVGDQAINVAFRTGTGNVEETTLYRDDEHRLEVETKGRPWSFDGDGALLRLVTEANRIKLAHYFDPYLAIHTSLVDPLPHQISAVYGEMLPHLPQTCPTSPEASAPWFLASLTRIPAAAGRRRPLLRLKTSSCSGDRPRASTATCWCSSRLTSERWIC